MFGFDFQAVSLDVDDPDALADRGGLASRRPLAVADAHAAAMRIDGLDHNHDLAEQASGAVIKQWIGAVVIAGCVEAAPADARGDESEDGEARELQRDRQPKR